MYYLSIGLLAIVVLSISGLVLVGNLPMSAYPFIMASSVSLIFVVNSLQLHNNRIAFKYIDDWMFSFITLVCLISILAVLGGWCYNDIVKTRPKEVTSPSFSYNRLFIAGTICQILSFIGEMLNASTKGGLIAMYSTAHNFYTGEQTNYVHLLFGLTFIGVIPYLQCLFGDRKLSPIKKGIIIFVCVLQILRAIVVGQRGWVLNLIFIYLTVPFFCLGKQPKVRQVAYFLLPAALFIMILPAVRGSIHLGSEDISSVPEQFMEALSETSKGDSSFGAGITDTYNDKLVGNEFILGAAIASAAWEHNDYTYGLSFYDVLTNPIPRQWWPEKPKDIAHVTQKQLISRYFDWRQLQGSFPTGIADIFQNFGFGSIIFWFLIGLIHRRIFDSASFKTHFYAQAVYTCLLMSSGFLLTQFVVPWGYQFVSMLIPTTLIYVYARSVKPLQKW